MDARDESAFDDLVAQELEDWEDMEADEDMIEEEKKDKVEGETQQFVII